MNFLNINLLFYSVIVFLFLAFFMFQIRRQKNELYNHQKIQLNEIDQNVQVYISTISTIINEKLDRTKNDLHKMKKEQIIMIELTQLVNLNLKEVMKKIDIQEEYTGKINELEREIIKLKNIIKRKGNNNGI